MNDIEIICNIWQEKINELEKENASKPAKFNESFSFNLGKIHALKECIRELRKLNNEQI